MLQESAAPIKSGGQRFRKVWFEDETTKNKYYVLVPLMTAKQDESYKGDFFTFWDPFWRAKVKRAIRTLNKTLRAFGMYMYAPQSEISDDDTELVQEFVKAVFYQSVEPSDISKWKSKKPIIIHYLAFAAMKYHRDMVFGGRSQLSTPVGLNHYLIGQFGERIIESNWARDWQAIWSKMNTIIDQMEKEALLPVASCLFEDNKEQVG